MGLVAVDAVVGSAAPYSKTRIFYLRSVL